ncbi:MAG: CpsB/CapC family capsule biosynthesis tyrosine phosphatase [Planctomycetota bacterium]
MGSILSPGLNEQDVPAPTGWVDLHNHLLPGIDDGPCDWTEALGVCRLLIRQGVSHVAATPHLFGPYTEPDRIETIHRRNQKLADQLVRAEIPLTLYQGADIRIDSAWEDAIERNELLTLGRGGKYLLIEPPHDVWIPARGVGRLLDDSNYVGVLTHPERHPHVQRQGLELLQEWVDLGMVLQVTAGSLLGDCGQVAQQLAWDIIASPVRAIVASDAHNTHRRPPRLGDAARAITDRLGSDAAQRLCRDLPWSMVSDTRPVTPPQSITPVLTSYPSTDDPRAEKTYRSPKSKHPENPRKVAEA